MIEADGVHILEEAMAKKHIAKYKDLAKRIDCSERSLRGWLAGEHVPRPYQIGKMSSVLGIDAHELFYPTKDDDMSPISRRTLIKGMVALPITLQLSQFQDSQLDSTILTLDSMTAQYRLLQRQGAKGIENGIKGHIASIQATLENTVDDANRRELWRVLSKAQLLARLNVTEKKDLAKAKTWNEIAIASAQNSGDSLLLAAIIGHLAHLYMMWPEDTAAAHQLIERAHELAGKNDAINGWLYSVNAATSAKEGNRRLSDESIERALLSIHRMPKTDESVDAYYTDFSLVGLQAFAGNSLLNVGEPVRAQNILQSIDLKQLAKNRHASAFYDIARAAIANGELEEAQSYAIKSIDTAVDTGRIYIIPRFVSLAQGIQQRDSHETHARAISEYAQMALQNQWRV